MRRAVVVLGLGMACSRAPAVAPRAAPSPDAAPPPVVAVRLLAPGVPAAEIERRFLVPLETAVGPARAWSMAVAGAGWLRVVGEREETLRLLAAAAPAGLESLEIVPDPDGRAPRARYVLSDPRRTAVELGRLHEEQIRSRLIMVSGVLAVRSCGGAVAELRVDVDGARLAGRGIALSDLQSAVAGAPRELVREVVLAGGVRLADVATVSEAGAQRCFAHGVDGPVLLGEIVARDAASLAAARAALAAPAGVMRAELEDSAPLAIDLPAGVSDAEAVRLLAQVARAARGVAELDRSPAALPRLPTEIVVHAPAGARERLSSIPGLSRARAATEAAPPAGDEPELAVIPDADKLSAHGLSTRDLDLAVAAAREGLPAGAARVWLPGGISPSLPVGRAQLGGVARIEQRAVPAAIVRRGGVRVTR